MARTYARVSVDRHHDLDWQALTFAEQGCYDFLLTHPKLSLCGALDVKVNVWQAKAAGDAPELLVPLLESLEAKRFVRWDRSTDELVIRTFVKNDKVLQNQNSGRGMWSSWRTIESEELRFFLVDNFPETAFEQRFNPPFPDPRIDRSDDRSNDRCQRSIEPPQPQPQPQPASADPSNGRWAPKHLRTEQTDDQETP
jgi:hypothetical protein